MQIKFFQLLITACILAGVSNSAWAVMARPHPHHENKESNTDSSD